MRHESTRIYQVSLELNELCASVIDRLPTGSAWLADQLKRAASGVTLAFSEGCRRTGAKDRRRFFDIAAASASEVSAVSDIAKIYKWMSEEERSKAKQMCSHLSAMLRLYR